MVDMHLSGTKSTIMVVDDNPDMVTIVKTILEIRGVSLYSYRVASWGDLPSLGKSVQLIYRKWYFLDHADQ